MGIIICGYRFSDMMYSEIYEYMPREFQMLLIASAAGIMEKNVDNLMSLSMPLKVHELLQTVEDDGLHDNAPQEKAQAKA